MPLMAWSRQAEITADRAGLLAIGDEALARRVLLAWSIRSARLLKQVNIEEWMKQEDASDDQMTRFSEMTTSSSMYTTRRLRLLGQVGERDRAHALEPDHPADSQAAHASASAANLRPDGFRACGATPTHSSPSCFSSRFRGWRGAWPDDSSGGWGGHGGSAGSGNWGGAGRLRSRDLQQMPGADADSSCCFARQDVTERSLPEVPKHFYDSAEARFSGNIPANGNNSADGGDRGRASETTSSAGVPLHTGKTGGRRWRCRSSAIETGFCETT